MYRTFKFEDVEPLFFDDTKSAKELIQYAFNEEDCVVGRYDTKGK